MKTGIEKERYSEKLVHEVKEAVKDYKDKIIFKGTADEVIKNLRNEANSNKKIY
ncbi:MAG: hypothetical protein IPM96_10480 [Ignavibacteria bacterium]|nr:hypothetical protein [Ignavibacteria bacterium]